MLYCASSFATEHPGSGEFIKRAVSEYGLAESDTRRLLQGAQFRQSIVDAISRPAEARPWHDYQPIFLTEKRISEGKKFWQDNHELIADAAKKYSVDEATIVAIIGVETFYGRITGSYRIIDALVTLSFYYPSQGLSSDRSYVFFFRVNALHTTGRGRGVACCPDDRFVCRGDGHGAVYAQ